MGCCGSKDEESSPEDAYRASTGRVQPPVASAYRHEAYRSAPHSNAASAYRPETPSAQRYPGGWVQPVLVVAKVPSSNHQQQQDAIAHSAHHNEERHFFQIFFSVLDHLPGFQGILRRWEREDQQAQHNDGGRCQMGKVWLDKFGYIKTLQRVQTLVTNKRFSSADRLKLTEWAMKVVRRREAEYNAAKGKGKADPKHLKVLEAWRGVKNTLQKLP